MKTNFDRHYRGNRAPFGVYIHAAWFQVRDSHLPAYKRLVDYMNSLPDVYLVTVGQAVDFTRNPRAVTPDTDGQTTTRTTPTTLASTQAQTQTTPQTSTQGQNLTQTTTTIAPLITTVRPAANVTVDFSPLGRSTRRGPQIMETCQKIRQPTCTPKLCQLRKEATNEERWMTSCVVCPDVYPWLGNPLGVRSKK